MSISKYTTIALMLICLSYSIAITSFGLNRYEMTSQVNPKMLMTDSFGFCTGSGYTCGLIEGADNWVTLKEGNEWDIQLVIVGSGNVLHPQFCFTTAPNITDIVGPSLRCTSATNKYTNMGTSGNYPESGKVFIFEPYLLYPKVQKGMTPLGVWYYTDECAYEPCGNTYPLNATACPVPTYKQYAKAIYGMLGWLGLNVDMACTNVALEQLTNYQYAMGQYFDRWGVDINQVQSITGLSLSQLKPNQIVVYNRNNPEIWSYLRDIDFTTDIRYYFGPYNLNLHSNLGSSCTYYCSSSANPRFWVKYKIVDCTNTPNNQTNAFCTPVSPQPTSACALDVYTSGNILVYTNTMPYNINYEMNDLTIQHAYQNNTKIFNVYSYGARPDIPPCPRFSYDFSGLCSCRTDYAPYSYHDRSIIINFTKPTTFSFISWFFKSQSGDYPRNISITLKNSTGGAIATYYGPAPYTSSTYTLRNEDLLNFGEVIPQQPVHDVKSIQFLMRYSGPGSICMIDPVEMVVGFNSSSSFFYKIGCGGSGRVHYTAIRPLQFVDDGVIINETLPNTTLPTYNRPNNTGMPGDYCNYDEQCMQNRSNEFPVAICKPPVGNTTPINDGMYYYRGTCVDSCRYNNLIAPIGGCYNDGTYCNMSAEPEPYNFVCPCPEGYTRNNQGVCTTTTPSSYTYAVRTWLVSGNGTNTTHTFRSQFTKSGMPVTSVMSFCYINIRTDETPTTYIIPANTLMNAEYNGSVKTSYWNYDWIPDVAGRYIVETKCKMVEETGDKYTPTHTIVLSIESGKTTVVRTYGGGGGLFLSEIPLWFWIGVIVIVVILLLA